MEPITDTPAEHHPCTSLQTNLYLFYPLSSAGQGQRWEAATLALPELNSTRFDSKRTPQFHLAGVSWACLARMALARASNFSASSLRFILCRRSA